MASGDLTIFNAFSETIGEKLVDLENDVFKVGLITTATTPAVTDADPRWGAGGTTNLSTNEVTPGGNYSAGGSTIATNTNTLSGAVTTFDGGDISILSNVSNPTDARWGIIYSDTDVGKRAVGFVDLGLVRDLSSGDFAITWNASGILTTTRA